MKRLLVLALLLASCNESFNAGRSNPGPLGVDRRNPVVLINDSPYENWMGEYAMLLANSGGPKLAGIIVVTGGVNTKIEELKTGWQKMVEAAQASGLRDIPDPTTSISEKLAKPSTGLIKDTHFSHSEGAILINDLSKSLSEPYRPLVVVAGTRLTDVAKAFLMDETVKDRVVVVASVGVLTNAGGADMGNPNGEMDPWADLIVTTYFRYIQVSARYDSKQEVPDDKVQSLPSNAFGQWIADKRPGVWAIPDAADQVSIAVVGIPDFATDIVSVSSDTAADAVTSEGPQLKFDKNGSLLLVRTISPTTAITRFWQMLQDPSVFGSADAGAK